jgi:hypothetical protein
MDQSAFRSAGLVELGEAIAAGIEEICDAWIRLHG